MTTQLWLWVGFNVFVRENGVRLATPLFGRVNRSPRLKTLLLALAF